MLSCSLLHVLYALCSVSNMFHYVQWYSYDVPHFSVFLFFMFHVLFPVFHVLFSAFPCSMIHVPWYSLYDVLLFHVPVPGVLCFVFNKKYYVPWYSHDLPLFLMFHLSTLCLLRRLRIVRYIIWTLHFCLTWRHSRTTRKASFLAGSCYVHSIYVDGAD